MTIELHPLCTLFPRLIGSEFDALRDDIKTNGLRAPIVLHDGMILDGGNRYRACIDAGITPDFVEFSGGNLVSFVLSANLHRRHMSAGQQAAIVASAQDWGKAQTVGNPQFKQSEQKCNVAPLATSEQRAAESGASLRTQKMADKVAKADPELAKQVAHGEKSLPQALREISPPKQPAYDPAEDEAKEKDETIRTLSEEVDSLRDRLAVEVMPASEEEKTTAADTIKSLRAEVKRLEIENSALVASRDSYQRENGELKRQCAMYRKQIEKQQRIAA